MPLPDCNIPTRAEWVKIRDKKGGEAGLAEVKLGKKLDAFHAAVKTGLVDKAMPAIAVLRTAALDYRLAVLKDYVDLAKAVKDSIIFKLDDFKAAIEAQLKEAPQQTIIPQKKEKKEKVDAQEQAWLKRAEEDRKTMAEELPLIIKIAKTAIGNLGILSDKLKKLLEKFKDTTVPGNLAPAVLGLVAEITKRLEAIHKQGVVLDSTAAKLARFDESVKVDFKAEIAEGIELLDERRKMYAWVRKSLDALKDKIPKGGGKMPTEEEEELAEKEDETPK